FSGNDAHQVYGNSATYGNMSPQMALIQGSLYKPCIGLPLQANLGGAGLSGGIAHHDSPSLTAPQYQPCTENYTQAKGDEPLSHILSDIPILSDNGNGGSKH
ncbi:rodlin, partial [Streptomyces sp. SP17KL33]|uniref:rodlin n=1 Tax=Streptomyces sp. SP17KL33 TaxID=3002534 RepID=UPI002E79E2EC